MGQAAAAPVAALTRTRVKDRYHVQKVRLGAGSFGTVWRAVDKKSGEVIAMKEIDKERAKARGLRTADIKREIRMMQVAHHENITKLYHTYEDRENFYLALEYCEGGDFGDKIQERGHTLDQGEATEWVRQICTAIAAMHSKGICHRDIKPDNFMVHHNQLKLADFGLAIFLPSSGILAEKVGTPAFMAPEQHLLPRQSKGYGQAVDVWAAGVAMYMVLCGNTHPFLDDRGSLDETLLLKGTLAFGRRHLLGVSVTPYAPLASEVARDLCKKMVEPEPLRRITAATALQSDYFKKAKPVTPPATQAAAMQCTASADISADVPREQQPPAHKRPMGRSLSDGARAKPRGSVLSVAPPALCKMGCGRCAAVGTTKNGHAFETCCRACAAGKGHDARCGLGTVRLTTRRSSMAAR